MSKGVPIKAAVVTMLVGATLIGNGAPPYNTDGLRTGLLLGLLTIGIFNALVSPPGTLWVRSFGIVCSFIGVLFPGNVRGIAVFLLWLVWPVAYLIVWSLTSERAEPESKPTPGTTFRARGAVAAIIAAVAIAVVAYKAIFAHHAHSRHRSHRARLRQDPDGPLALVRELIRRPEPVNDTSNFRSGTDSKTIDSPTQQA